MLPDEVEAYRELMEARSWLKRGYTTKMRVADLMVQIAKKRGQAAADRLRTVMLEQWARRSEWLTQRK